jgi:hypothetical protein
MAMMMNTGRKHDHLICQFACWFEASTRKHQHVGSVLAAWPAKTELEGRRLEVDDETGSTRGF